MVAGHNAPSRGGLSPLTRGNRNAGQEQYATMGPIPAHAGEPEMVLPEQQQAGAYPRSRGGTEYENPAVPGFRGLSPLTRGNLSRLTC